MQAKIAEFCKCENDIDRWKWVSDNKDLAFTIVIDNDDIAIAFTDEENSYFHFDTWGQDCISCLLDNIGVTNEYC